MFTPSVDVSEYDMMMNIMMDLVFVFKFSTICISLNALSSEANTQGNNIINTYSLFAFGGKIHHMTFPGGLLPLAAVRIR